MLSSEDGPLALDSVSINISLLWHWHEIRSDRFFSRSRRWLWWFRLILENWYAIFHSSLFLPPHPWIVKWKESRFVVKNEEFKPGVNRRPIISQIVAPFRAASLVCWHIVISTNPHLVPLSIIEPNMAVFVLFVLPSIGWWLNVPSSASGKTPLLHLFSWFALCWLYGGKRIVCSM